jgi:hypothetical protein
METNLKIIPYNEKRHDFEHYHKTGGSEIRYPGFECMNGIWKFAQDGVTDITGRPGSGKTEFALELLFYQAETFSKRFIIYVPDVGSYNEIRRKLLVKYYRRPFRGYENAINEEIKGELTSAVAFIDHHFLIAGKEKITKPVTPIDVWNFTATYQDKSGHGVDGVLIDSWKNLFHSYTGREDLYHDYVLSYRNELAENCGKHFMTIAHSNKMPKGDDGKRKVPDGEDIKGGGWTANGKTIITVDRPEKGSDACDIHFAKVKPDTLGVASSIIGEMDFYWKHSRYRETINGNICYAGEGKKLIKTPF